MGMPMTYYILTTPEYSTDRFGYPYCPSPFTHSTFISQDAAEAFLKSRTHYPERYVVTDKEPAWWGYRTSGFWSDTFANIAEQLPDFTQHGVAILSEEDNTMVKYWNCQTGRWTTQKLGRFLNKLGIPPKQVEVYVSWYKTVTKPKLYSDYPTTFHQDRDFVRVYTSGPYSCMHYSADHWGTDGHHPVEVFDTPDWEIAYLTNVHGQVVARALVVPEREIFCRVYPTPGNYCDEEEDTPLECASHSEEMQERLTNELRSKGYRSAYSLDTSELEGLRLKRIDLPENYILTPYLDHLAEGEVRGEYIVLIDEGSLDLETTSGKIAYVD